MRILLEISVKNMDPSPAIEARIREKADKLDRFYQHIMRCRVTVGAPHRCHHQGRLYEVNMGITIPKGELTVPREEHRNHAHEDIQVAIRDAFDAAVRQLEDHARRLRGATKIHEIPQHGRIVRLFPWEGYGFIETTDGQEVYFHKNSMVEEGFGRLEVGSEAPLSVTEGESSQGPQATR
ncbi:ribosome-associated translation inhibitor RaiA/cold shock CspA family protein [Skermanella aerolata]|uniref:HPF/RaiA family ribosome-associated protein n=1 Tax=Skermanella aerolata TaxID=393310 RepID=UPI003D24A63A